MIRLWWLDIRIHLFCVQADADFMYSERHINEYYTYKKGSARRYASSARIILFGNWKFNNINIALLPNKPHKIWYRWIFSFSYVCRCAGGDPRDSQTQTQILTAFDIDRLHHIASNLIWTINHWSCSKYSKQTHHSVNKQTPPNEMQIDFRVQRRCGAVMAFGQSENNLFHNFRNLHIISAVSLH